MNRSADYKDLTSYIISLPKGVIEKIFDHPTTCLAIFRELPELAKIIVIRLLLLNQEVPQATVDLWIDSKYKEERQAALKILTNLGIWQEKRTSMPAWLLTPSFKQHLSSGIFEPNRGMPSAGEEASPAGGGVDPKLIEKLDAYAIERWESILKYIVNPKDPNNQISNSTKDVLKFANLMKSYNDGSSSNNEADNDSVVLTAAAFQFLLLNRKVQIWYFIIKLLDYFLEKNQQDLSECLMLLFELSFSTFGKDYSCEGFSERKTDFLQELRKLGLVFMKTRKIRRFYPTRLAIQLANGINDNVDVKQEEKGYIVVETNYRIYAYTDSNLQISLLALFTDLMYRFPNMVVGQLTRDSCREAFKMGITSGQIVSFLRSNAHPQIATRKPVLPETVADQINFWYNERNRLTMNGGVFYGAFNSDDDYFLLKNYSKDMDALIWSNDQKRLMIVKESSHDLIKKFYKQNKPK